MGPGMPLGAAYKLSLVTINLTLCNKSFKGKELSYQLDLVELSVSNITWVWIRIM
jgi:hypothetical protein